MWVVLHHTRKLIFEGLPSSAWLQPLLAAGNFAVPLFFVLSGYVLGLRYASVFRDFNLRMVFGFLLLRLGRIYPVHLFTLGIAVALFVLGILPKAPATSLSRLAENILLIQAWTHPFHMSWNYPAWSISSEWFAYLLFPAVCGIGVLRTRVGLQLLLVVSCLMSVFVYAFLQRMPFIGLAAVVPPFCGGIALATLARPGDAGVFGASWYRFACPAILVLPFFVPTGPWQASALLALFFVVVWSLGLSGSRPRLLQARPLVFLGDISYSLYMTHALVLAVLAHLQVSSVLQAASLPVRAAILAAMFVAIFLAALGCHFAVERPARGWVRRRVPTAWLSRPVSAPTSAVAGQRS